MKKLFLFAVIVLMGISCERTATTGDKSPIKGTWECPLNGMPMTLDFGDKGVEYSCYIEFFDATAIYSGTYTIKDSDITITFTSLSTKNSEKMTFTNPKDMPKKAVLMDNSTIQYMEYSFNRK